MEDYTETGTPRYHSNVDYHQQGLYERHQSIKARVVSGTKPLSEVIRRCDVTDTPLKVMRILVRHPQPPTLFPNQQNSRHTPYPSTQHHTIHNLTAALRNSLRKTLNQTT